jgi:hypothetical protein
MLEKIKGLGSQLTNMATDAVDGVTSTVKQGAENIVTVTGAAASAINDKAVRSAVEQMRVVLGVAVEELHKKPVSDQPVTLTTSVDFGLTSLQMQIVVNPAQPSLGEPKLPKDSVL